MGRPPRHRFEQGTAVTKKYQNDKIDTPAGDGFVVPERVSVAMAEIADSMREACSPWPWAPACRSCRC